MALSMLWFLLCTTAFLSLVRAQGSVQTIFPASIPLAVKTPYMSVWYKSVNGSAPLSNSWPLIWNLTVSVLFSTKSDKH